MIPDTESDPEIMGYEWTTVSMNKRSLELQMTFENPLYISIQEESEVLAVTFNDGTAFLSEAGLPLSLIDEDQLLIERDIPKQLPASGGD